jgi:type IV pilus assembly protein PilB
LYRFSSAAHTGRQKGLLKESEVSMKKPRLGSILLETGVIDELQLQAALAYQRQWGMPLGRALVEKRLCTTQQVMQALATQTGLPVIDLDKESLGHQQSTLLTLKVAEQYRTVPLRVEGTRQEVLVIAMAAPAPLASIDAVQLVSGKRRVVVHLASDEAIGRAIGRIYRGWTQPNPAPSVPAPLPRRNEENDALIDILGEPVAVPEDPITVLLYGWTEQAGSTLNALLLSQCIAAHTVSTSHVLVCDEQDIVIAPFSALEELLAAHRVIPGRLIVVSKSPASDIPKARRAGAWGLLTPPFDSRRLAETVQRCQSAKSFVWAT